MGYQQLSLSVTHQLPFVVGTFNSVVTDILKRMQSTGQVILPCDMHNLANYYLRPELVDSYDRIDFCTTDGMPLVWYFRRLLKMQSIERVYGPDLMTAILLKTQSHKHRHLFFGTTQSTLKLLENKLKTNFPKLKSVGYVSPPQAVVSDLVRLATMCIKRQQPTIVWIAIASPKQVQVAVALKKKFPKIHFFCVGAAFDFLADQKKTAPVWWQRHGLEWLFRLSTEPRRLSYRYLYMIPQFLFKLSFDQLKLRLER